MTNEEKLKALPAPPEGAQFKPMVDYWGKALYDLYRKSPPLERRGAAHVVAYWQGFDGGPALKHVRHSASWWAYRAGVDNRKKGILKGIDGFAFVKGGK